LVPYLLATAAVVVEHFVTARELSPRGRDRTDCVLEIADARSGYADARGNSNADGVLLAASRVDVAE